MLPKKENTARNGVATALFSGPARLSNNFFGPLAGLPMETDDAMINAKILQRDNASNQTSDNSTSGFTRTGRYRSF